MRSSTHRADSRRGGSWSWTSTTTHSRSTTCRHARSSPVSTSGTTSCGGSRSIRKVVGWRAAGAAATRWVLDFAAVVDGKDRTHATVFDQVADQGGTAATSLSATGLLATAGGGDSRVKLWNVATGQQVVELTTSAQATAPIAFSPDGSYLVYNDGGVLRRYLMDVDRLIELAKSRLTRGLTADECRRHLDASQCA